MNIEHLIIVSLILSILTIGAVSASQDVVAFDELAVNEGEIEIEESSVEDGGIITDSKDSDNLEKSNDLDEPMEYTADDFNVVINETVDLEDENSSVITFDTPEGLNVSDGTIAVYVHDQIDGYFRINKNQIKLNELNIKSEGIYPIEVKYIPHEDASNNLTLATGTLKAIKQYSKDTFSIHFENRAASKEGVVISVADFPTKGNLIVYVDGNPRFNRTVRDIKHGEQIDITVSDLNITKNGQYMISVKYVVNATYQEINLGQQTLNVDIDYWNDDEYLYIDYYADILDHDNTFIYINEDSSYINGTVYVYIDGDLKLTEIISDTSGINNIYFTIDDLKLYNNITLGKHTVKVIYMKNDVEMHDSELGVQFIITPDFEHHFVISVGEKESFVVTMGIDFTGTATLYNVIGEYYDEKGTVFATANFVNGVAKFNFDSLAKGEYYFCLYINNLNYESTIIVNVLENTPGFSASVSASEIIVGNNVVVNFNGPKSNESVSIYLDDIKYQSVLVVGSFSETISGLSLGTHKIGIKFEDENSFYSNTFFVTVKNKPTTPVAPIKKADKIKLTLKKIKVRKSAKKLVLYATLKINGKAVKGKVIKFKFNKKTYKAKTNKKGVVKATVKKAVLKKLKVGKKVVYTAKYGKITKKVTVKVKK